MTEPVDFSACERLPGRAYNGAQLLTDLQRQFYKTYLAARYEALFPWTHSRSKRVSAAVEKFGIIRGG